MRWMSLLGWITLGVVLAMGPMGCTDDTSSKPESAAPDLPPVESMKMDLSFFMDPGGEGFAQGEEKAAGTKLNFLNAAVRAAFINVTVITVLTPPSLAFAAAIHTFPSHQDDGSYLWIYTWVEGDEEYQIRLYGKLDGDWVDWELFVSLPSDTDPELWFSGRSHMDRDEGHWTFRDFTIEGDPEVLRIDWRVVSDEDATLDFTNIRDGHEEEGDELRYRTDGALHSIEYYDDSDTETWDIIWNENDGTGSLRFPDYNDSQRACWDSDQEDIDCPPTMDILVERLSR